ncbi:hypothetical protein SAMN05216311_1107 [Chitinophaga sp. CF418]|nr:hypothetical protein SAMN05216311_1107 [Chitinophaga sp. CF418]
MRVYVCIVSIKHVCILPMFHFTPFYNIREENIARLRSQSKVKMQVLYEEHEITIVEIETTLQTAGLPE